MSLIPENFPVLEIDPKDICGSWKMFLDRFVIATRFAVCNRGKTKVTVSGREQEVDVFDAEMRLCALLKAIGVDGLQVLIANGIDVASQELTYDQVLAVLKNNYEREESLNVKVWNFNSACQQRGEDCRDYLRRVEHLSRTTGLFKSYSTTYSADQTAAANAELERVRKSLAQVIVVNGLRDLQLRRELMAKNDLDWEKLCRILQCRGTAEESLQKLEISTQSPVHIKKEVAFSHSDNYKSEHRRSKSRRCYQCGSYSHQYSDCPHIVCFECKSTGHIAKECPELRRRNRRNY